MSFQSWNNYTISKASHIDRCDIEGKILLAVLLANPFPYLHHFLQLRQHYLPQRSCINSCTKINISNNQLSSPHPPNQAAPAQDSSSKRPWHICPQLLCNFHNDSPPLYGSTRSHHGGGDERFQRRPGVHEHAVPQIGGILRGWRHDRFHPLKFTIVTKLLKIFVGYAARQNWSKCKLKNKHILFEHKTRSQAKIAEWPNGGFPIERLFQSCFLGI